LKANYTDNPGADYSREKRTKLMPTLKGFLTGNQIVVWCPFCGVFHIHGWPVNSSMEKNHRVAHCFPKYIDHQEILSPLDETGYYIKPFTKRELKKMGVDWTELP